MTTPTTADVGAELGAAIGTHTHSILATIPGGLVALIGGTILVVLALVIMAGSARATIAGVDTVLNHPKERA